MNEGTPYTLEINAPYPAVTFCVFFRRGFFEQVRADSARGIRQALDDLHPVEGAPREIPEMLRRGGAIPRRLATLARVLREGETGGSCAEEIVLMLAGDLARLDGERAQELARLTAVRSSTREELYRRLHRGRDFLDASLARRTSLEDAAREACLSPFHFLRGFSMLFGQTPHRYLVARRLERAARLLASTDLPAWAIASECGFESPTSFSALYRRRYGKPPGHFRRAARLEKGSIE